MNSEQKHSDFSPSSFERRFCCPASYLLEMGKPDKSSATADEGTRIHAEIAAIISGTTSEQETDILAQRCFTRFESAIAVFDNPEVYIEKQLAAKVSDIENFGTVDAVVIGGESAIIIDWKTGFNRVPHPSKNWQLMWYTLFVFDNFPKVQEITATIYNPRIFQDECCHYRREEEEQLRKRLAEVIEICKGGSPAPNVGQWCDYCKGKAECPAVQNAIQEMQKTLPLKEMADDDIAALMQRVNAVKAMCEEITEEVKSRCRLNGNCGNYTVKSISGGIEITDNEEMLTAMEKFLTGYEIAKTAKYSVTALAEAVYEKRKAAGEKVTKTGVKADITAALENCTKRKPDTERLIC